MPEPEGITAAGVVFLAVAWSLITALTAYFLWKLIRTPPDPED